MPWVHKGKIKLRQVTQLALSFDHRIVDGELGSRFLADIGALLHDPGTALASGVPSIMARAPPIRRVTVRPAAGSIAWRHRAAGRLAR